MILAGMFVGRGETEHRRRQCSPIILIENETTPGGAGRVLLDQPLPRFHQRPPFLRQLPNLLLQLFRLLVANLFIKRIMGRR